MHNMDEFWIKVTVGNDKRRFQRIVIRLRYLT